MSDKIRSQAALPQEKGPPVLSEWLGGPQSWPGRLGEETNFVSLQRFESRTVLDFIAGTRISVMQKHGRRIFKISADAQLRVINSAA